MVTSAIDLSGISCPLVTPFEGERVDHEALGALVDHVREGGVDALVPCGTTGEFASLSDEEYRAVLETTVDRSGDLPVVAGTADTSVAGVREKIAAAEEVGADAALLTLPYFHTANDPAGQSAFVDAVAADSSLPIYLYNIPACTGQALDLDVVERASDSDSVVGIKDSSGDFNYFAELVRRTGDHFQVLEGYDSHLSAALGAGATGGVNALSNVVPAAFADLYDAVEDGDVEEARRIQMAEISPLFQQCIEHGFAPACKSALAATDVLESDAVRPPLVTLPDEARTAIVEALRDS